MKGVTCVENWTESAKRDAQVRLDQVERRRSEYKSKLAELDAEAEGLSRFISVIEKMGNDQYWKTLLGAGSEAQRETAADAERLDWLSADLSNLGRLSDEKPQGPLQTRRLSEELPDLPPALDVTRQPDKSNTSYRVAALMKLHGGTLSYDDVWQELKRRNWVDPAWSKPQAAVRQAMRRTVQYGWTVRAGSNAYRYDPSSHADRRQQVSGAMDRGAPIPRRNEELPLSSGYGPASDGDK